MSFYRRLAVGAVGLISLMAGTAVYADDSSPSGQYWFDTQSERHAFTPGKFEIDVSNLNDGMHWLTIVLENDGAPCGTASRYFIKSYYLTPNKKHQARIYVDGKLHQTSDLIADGIGQLHFDVDLSNVRIGMHSLRAEVVSSDGSIIDAGEKFFLRQPTVGEEQFYQLVYLIDNLPFGSVNAPRTSDCWHLTPDVSKLTSGLHSISAYLANPYGMATPVRTAWFVKTPDGGDGVIAYEYWLNENEATKSRVELPNRSEHLRVMDLLEMPQEPICSSRYTFAVEDEGPVVYALNDFHINFFDADYRITSAKGRFTDTRVKEAVTDIDALSSNGSNRVESLKDNEIRWFNFKAEMGDSVSLYLSNAAMYELYSPNAELLIARSGADAVTPSACTLTKNGTYYLAVHDIGSSYYRNVDVIFSHIPRFAFLYDKPTDVAEGSMLIYNLVGNGFSTMKSFALTNGTFTVEGTDIVVNDNNHASIRFDLPKGREAYGEYDLLGVFRNDEKGCDETVRGKAAVTVTAYKPGGIEVTIDHPLRVIVPDEVYIRVTNTSNRGLWGIPLNYAFEKPEGGLAISYKNFYPLSYDDPDGKIPLFHTTENLLGTGNPGYFFPVYIPYLGPNQTLNLAFGLRYDPTQTVNMYAWAGQAWSEEFEEILSDGFDFDEILKLEDTNILSARAICYIYFWMLYHAQHPAKLTAPMNQTAASLPMRSPIAKFPSIPDELRQSNNMAGHVSNVYQAVGRTAAGIHNGLRLRGIDAYGIDLSDDTYSSLRDYSNSLKQGMPTPGSILAGAVGQEIIYDAYQNFVKKCPETPNPMPQRTPIEGYRSWDPNEIKGYTSPAGSNYIGIDVKTINYMIEFENDPEMANAAAHKVAVTDMLDGDMFDLSTLRMRAVDIGGRTLELNGESQFVKTLDLRPELNVIAQISLTYDQSTGKAKWDIISLDPLTLEPTVDVMQGVLPVNNNGEGIGQIFFDIDLRKGLANGAKIRNEAEIVFDDNDPIITDSWVNVLDYVRPQSSILSIKTDDYVTFEFDVEGSDRESGIWMYDLFVRMAESSEWVLVMPNIQDERFTYIAEEAIIGADFAVIAIDKAGNRQDESTLQLLLGDADGNGKVDANDVLIIRNYYMKVPTEINLKNADATRDGEIDAQDALSTRNIYLDPTAKALSNKLRTRKK